MKQPRNERDASFDRRHVILGASATLAGAALARAGSAKLARTLGEKELRVALVGCGGRGTGAALQALSTAGPVKLVAMADAFADRLEGCLAGLEEHARERVDVPPERRFVGFDAYQRAIDQDVDVVILATQPGFRPAHFEHAVARGRHVFMEKPVAVDAPGVRRVLAANEEAKKLGLKVAVGLQRHHDARYVETVKRLQDGAIGEIGLLRCYWNSGGVWVWKRQPSMTEIEYQMRNWYYFNWLCGDHIVEQHIHNIDVCNWVKGAHPIRAQGQGGRQVRVGPDYGEIYDHHFVEFTYADGTVMLSQCRHMPDTWSSVSEHAHGTLGTCDIGSAQIRMKDGARWKSSLDGGDPYQVEHDRLFAAIREDRPHNEGDNGALSTMTAILGRMATYSGREIAWDDALQSELSLGPARLAWDAEAPVRPGANGLYPIPTPGVTRAL